MLDLLCQELLPQGTADQPACAIHPTLEHARVTCAWP